MKSYRMNKFNLFVFFLTVTLCAQIPNGYYDSATGTGFALKTQLKNIIDNHTDRGFNALWTFYETADDDAYYEDDGSVLDIYSEIPNGVDANNLFFTADQCGVYTAEGECYNREHLFPQGFYNEQSPMRSDAHQVVPVDGYLNGRRSNFPFGVVNNPSYTSENGSKVGPNTFGNYNGTVFEPIDEFKGDVARMLLYFATRYEDEVTSSTWDAHTAANNPLNGTNDQVYEDWYVLLLLNWHAQDPVSAKEIDRNNDVYNYQGNRNPFVDHPEYANQIWGNSVDTEPPTAPTNLIVSNETPSTLNLAWNASTDNDAVESYDVFVDGTFYENTTSTSIIIENLNPSTTYALSVLAKDLSGNPSTLSNVVNGTTTALPPVDADVFFSEYVEGSGLNKAIEIANFSGQSIDLANYTIRLASNGNPFSATLSFTNGETLANGEVLVIAQTALASEVCLSQVDLFDNNVTNFNGNDAVGLFKSGVLIDVIGEEGNTAAFAGDEITIRRKSNINGPSAIFDLNQWDVYPRNSCDLGNHTFLSTTDLQSNKLEDLVEVYQQSNQNHRVYYRLLDRKINIQKILIYQSNGQLILEENNPKPNQPIVLPNKANGVYWLQFVSENQHMVKKVLMH